MKVDQIRQLEIVAALAYRKAYMKAKPVLEEEAGIASRLARLERMAAQRSDRRMHAVGADQAWMAWTDRSRRQLTIELAAARARRLMVLDEVSKAFGQLEGSRLLHAREREARREKAEQQRLSALVMSQPKSGR